ncbi:MAG: nucleotidyltransferase [Rhizobiales bacterium]|nr:nucleotidyltransferase [Hyphomicrobiales bacterium]
MNQSNLIERLRSARSALQDAGVMHAYLFGSMARGDADELSDVDVAVDLAPGVTVSPIELCRLERLITDATGLPADVTIREKLTDIRDKVEAEAIEIF